MTAEKLISSMGYGWKYETTESSARLVAEHAIETMYSEEEVIQLVSDWIDYRMSEDVKSKVKFKKWFEKFKKK
jgi:hypothetical protein